MKEAFWGYFLIVLGIMIIVIVLIIQNITSTSEEDYYLIKEVMKASMIESVDYGTYRLEGEIKISKEKFVENFLRRFAESVSPNKTYNIEFYEIYEMPPKASVKVTTSTGSQVITETATDFDIITVLNGIIETKY
jgi:hypothetical protein